jgi:DNA-binding beta-propeller fold protein YncE
MKSFFSVLFYILIVILFNCQSAISQSNYKPYHLQKTIKIHDSYGWDYLSADEVMRHLFVSHGIKIIVVDMDKDTIIDEISNTIGVHGIALNTNLNKGFTSNGKRNSITVFNLNNCHLFDTISIDGKNPDAILFDKSSNQIFTFNGKSKDVTVIDPLSMRTETTIALNGKPEFAVTDGMGSLFVNIEDKNEIVHIDSKQSKVLESWSIAPGDEPTGMAIDTANKLLFSVCSNKLLVVSNYRDNKIVTTFPIGSGADAVVFDPITKIIYSSNGEGNVTIIQQESATKYSLLQSLITQKGCRTMMIDKRTKKIYLPAAKFEEGKRRIIPNTFEILVFSNQ